MGFSLLLLGSSSCSRSPVPASVTRLAVLPANVLITSPASEWLRFAAPLVLEQDLAPVASLIVSVAPSESAVYQLGSTEALRVTITENRSAFDLAGNLFQTAKQANQASFSVRAQPSAIIAGLNALAKQINPGAAPFSTASDRALELLSAGLTASDQSAKVAHLREAIASDQSFGLAYVALIETLAANADPDLRVAIQIATSHRNAFKSLDRARLDLLAAQYGRAPLLQQIAAAAALVKVNPNNADALSALGAGLFLTGDASEGEQAFHHALEVSPANPGIERQFALGLIESRQFSRAEKLLASLGPSSYLQADVATCILLSGDTPRATQVFQQFLKTVANPDARTLFGATWRAWTGDLADAIDQLRTAQMTDVRAAQLAVNQIAIWEMLKGPPPAATVPLSALPGANGKAKELVNAYGLFLFGHYGEAVQAWRAILNGSGDTDLRARAMLADSAKEAGRPVQVKVLPFLPEVGDLYSAVSLKALQGAH